MELEWDEEKRQKALRERGMDFADLVWIDFESTTTRPDLRKDYGEPRFNTFGYLHGRLVTFCWTTRGSRIRVISMRKANDREKKEFEACSLEGGD